MKLKLRNNGWLAPSKSPLSEFFEANEFLNERNRDGFSLPAVNVFEDTEEYTIELAVPGMEKEDFTLSIEDGVLTISAESELEDVDEFEGEYTYREYNYKTFSRSFNLPEDAMEDDIEAIYKNGELIISIPKAADVVKQGREIYIG